MKRKQLENLIKATIEEAIAKQLRDEQQLNKSNSSEERSTSAQVREGRGDNFYHREEKPFFDGRAGA
jgi:hypothetical protein